MAIGKNKRLTKAKKGMKGKKVVDLVAKKEWYDVRAPACFAVQDVGRTCVTPTAGTKIASDGLKGRVFEVNLADLQSNEDETYRKMKIRAEEVSGKNLLTNFFGMDLTSDKLRSLVRKNQTMIEANIDAKTTDGYVLRLFAIAFTKKRLNTARKTAYAQTAQIRAIRKKMVEIMAKEVSTNDLKSLVKIFIPEQIGKEIERACDSIYPLRDAYVRKVKMLRTPKFDVTRLMEMHSTAAKDENKEKGKAVGKSAKKGKDE